jgi:peptide/nickel transport system substrate-binding protein
VNLSRTNNVGNLKVRQAMMHAVDRQALVDALSYGSSKPTLQFFASTSPAYDPALESLYPFDPAKAKKLLAEAGFKDGVEISMILLNITDYRPLAEAYQAMMAEVGIRIKFDIVDGSQFPVFRRPPTRGDILLARWGGRPDPLQVFQELIGTGGSFNPTGVATPEIDTLIDKARAMTPDNPERVKVLRQIARLGVEYAGNVPIMSRSNVYAFKPGCFTGLDPFLPQGDDRFNDVRISAKCK